MKQRKVFSAAALAAVGAVAVIVSASFAGRDCSAAGFDDDDDALGVPEPLGGFPPGADGMVTDETGKSFFTTPCGDLMNAAGEIVMRAEDVFAAEARRRCGTVEPSSYEQCAAALREQVPCRDEPAP